MTAEARCLLCSCNGTLPLPPRLPGVAVIPVRALCRGDVGVFRATARKPGTVVVGCTQEQPLFEELAERMEASADLRFVNLRELAACGAEGDGAGPKMAALVTLAAQAAPAPVDTVDFTSAGSLLVIGPAEAALDWADRLADDLAVAVLATGPGVRPPKLRAYPRWSGGHVTVSGHLGAFHVGWRQDNPIDPERCVACHACVPACPEGAIGDDLRIDLARCARHGACVTACGDIAAIDFGRLEALPRREDFDLILDLSRVPLIRRPHLPDGYFAPGNDALAQSEAARHLVGLVGEFEKPRYLKYSAARCAHMRQGKIGCTACIDICSTAAITSDNGRIRVDGHLCAGCGGCATACPTGAIRHAYPAPAELMTAVQRGLAAYRAAGGRDACLLVHDSRSLPRLLDLAHTDQALPARVIPLQVHDVAAFGLDLALATLCYGAAQVRVLADGEETAAYGTALQRQFGYGNEILAALGHGTERLGVIVDAAPGAALQRLPQAESLPEVASFLFVDDKRIALDFVFGHLLAAASMPAPAPEIPLTPGAPFGTVAVSEENCTVCLSCVGACPTGALLDTPDQPRLRFVERNCVQCGLCRDTCPEDAIALVPRLSLTAEARRPRTLIEAQPFHCISCDKPFGSRQMVRAMVGRLANHSMYADDDARRRLEMCADCRIVAMMGAAGEVSFLGAHG